MSDFARLIYGIAGAGKTEEIINIAGSVSQAAEVIIIVPEQFSFEIERKLMIRGIDSSSTGRVEVLSFERLCENIFRQLGGIASDVLDNTAKLMLIFTAIREVLPELTVYKKISGSETGMLSSIDDMKRYGVTPQRLRDVLASCDIDSDYLKSKLTDILRIYETYDMLMGTDYCDPVDDIYRAMRCEGIREFFAGKYILVDGFYHFTPMQWELLELMLCSSSGFAISMLCDSLEYRKNDVFTVTKSTAERFADICRRNLIELSYTRLENSYRLAVGTALEFLEKLASGYNPENVEALSFDNVKLISASNSWDEMCFIAAEIQHLCRKSGYTYGDFVITARDIESYKTKLDSIFKMYDIPLFYSDSDKLAQRPFFSYIHTVLSILVEGMRLELLLKLARNICSGVSEDEYFDLENYCYIWNLEGKEFRSEFTLPVDGLSENINKNSKVKLDRLNRVRKRIVEPILKLQNSLKNATGNVFVKVFYALLVGEQKGEPCIVHNIRRAVPKEEMAEYAEYFDIFVGILDTVSRLVGERNFSVSDIARLAILAVENLEKSKIPNISDCVMVVNADSARVNSPKVVFVIGLNVGEFPAGVSAGGFFSAAEHIAMTNLGIPIRPDNIHRAIMERLYLYTALTQGSERVYLCHDRRTLTGDEHTPTSIFAQLMGYGVEVLDTAELSEGFFVTNMHTLKLAYARAENISEKTALGKLLAGEIPGDTDSTSADGVVDSEIVKRILGTQLRLSHTGIQTFFECHYKYFLNYILHISKRQRVEDMGALIYGTARHSVLEHIFASEDSWESFKNAPSYPDLCIRIDDELVNYIHRCTGGASLSPRLTYGIRRLSAGIARFVEMQIRRSEGNIFSPILTEAEIDINGSFSPILLNTPSADILVRGKVDRVDIANMDGYSLVKVVDYKSGEKKIDSLGMENGLNMQLMIYLSAICSDMGSAYGRLCPAGIEYSTLHHAPKPHIGNISQADRAQYIDEKLAGARMYIDIPELSCEAGDKTTQLVDQMSFAKLFGAVYKNICAMSDCVYGGDFTPKYSKDICENCNIRTICKKYIEGRG